MKYALRQLESGCFYRFMLGESRTRSCLLIAERSTWGRQTVADGRRKSDRAGREEEMALPSSRFSSRGRLQSGASDTTGESGAGMTRRTAGHWSRAGQSNMFQITGDARVEIHHHLTQAKRACNISTIEWGASTSATSLRAGSSGAYQ